eukprot:1158426-Pelagomonas_calceolata.AAC.9
MGFIAVPALRLECYGSAAFENLSMIKFTEAALMRCPCSKTYTHCTLGYAVPAATPSLSVFRLTQEEVFLTIARYAAVENAKSEGMQGALKELPFGSTCLKVGVACCMLLHVLGKVAAYCFLHGKCCLSALLAQTVLPLCPFLKVGAQKLLV